MLCPPGTGHPVYRLYKVRHLLRGRWHLENAELNRQFLARIPLGRWGDPKDVGQLALYLCSDEAGFITGTDIIVDGGWTAQ